jgi:hypothetical protein
MTLPEFIDSIEKLITYYRTLSSSSININDELTQQERGKTLSSAGPSSYYGDILEDPEIVWADDDDWLPRDLSTVLQQEEEGKINDRIKNALDRIKLQGDKITSYWKQKYETKANKKNRVGQIVFVPHQTSFHEFDFRVIKLG